MGRKIIPQVCPECKKLCAWFTGSICHNCYRKYHWKKKLIKCKNCGRMLPHKAFGLCSTCHVRIMHYDCVKRYNFRKWHHLELEVYRTFTKSCIICGFDKIVDLHHMDKNHENTSENNLVGLCPNHHKMLHDCRYERELKEILRQKLSAREVSADSLLNQPTTEAPLKITLLNPRSPMGN